MLKDVTNRRNEAAQQGKIGKLECKEISKGSGTGQQSAPPLTSSLPGPIKTENDERPCSRNSNISSSMGSEFMDFANLMPDMFASPDHNGWMPLSCSPASTDLQAVVAQVSLPERNPSRQSIELSASLGVSTLPAETPSAAWFPSAQRKDAEKPLPFIDDTMIGNYTYATAAPPDHLLHSPGAGVLQGPCLKRDDAGAIGFNFPSLLPPDVPNTPCLGDDENSDPFFAFKSFLMHGGKDAASYHTPMPGTKGAVLKPHANTDAATLGDAPTPMCITGAAKGKGPFSFVHVCTAQPATPRFGSALPGAPTAPQVAKALPVLSPLPVPELPAHTSAKSRPPSCNARLSLTVEAKGPFALVRWMVQQEAGRITCVQQARECMHAMGQDVAASTKTSQKPKPDCAAFLDAGFGTPPYKKLMRHLNPGKDSLADDNVVPTPAACKVQKPAAHEAKPLQSADSGRIAANTGGQQPIGCDKEHKPCGPNSDASISEGSPAQFQDLVRNIVAARYESPAVPGELNPGHSDATKPKITAAAKGPKHKPGIPPPATQSKSSGSPAATSPLNPFAALVHNIQAARYESPAIRLPRPTTRIPSAGSPPSPAVSLVESSHSPNTAPAAGADTPLASHAAHTPTPTLRCPLSEQDESSHGKGEHKFSSPRLHSLHFSSAAGTDATDVSPLSGLVCRSIGGAIRASPLSCVGEISPDSCLGFEAGHATSPPTIVAGLNAPVDDSTRSSSNVHPAPAKTSTSMHASGVTSSLFSRGCMDPIMTPVRVQLQPVVVEGGSELVQVRLVVPSAECEQSVSLSSQPHSCSSAVPEQHSAPHKLPQSGADMTSSMEIDLSDTVVIGDITPRNPGVDSPCISARLLPVIHEDSPSFVGVLPAGSADEVSVVEGHEDEGQLVSTSPSFQNAPAPGAVVAPQLSASPQMPEDGDSEDMLPSSAPITARTPVSMHVQALTESMHTLRRLKASHAPLTPQCKDMIAQLDSAAQMSSGNSLDSPISVRASISSWLRKNNMDGGILNRSCFKAIEELWAKAQEAVQLQNQVDHLRVLDLEMAERTQAECNGQADALQQANRQLVQQNAALEASNAQLQAEVQRLRQIQATVAVSRLSAKAPTPSPKDVPTLTPQASKTVDTVNASAQSTPLKQKVTAKEIISVGDRIQEGLTGLHSSMDAVCEQLAMPCNTGAAIADMRHLCRLLKRKAVASLGNDVITLFEHMRSVLKFLSDSKAALDELLAKAEDARKVLKRSHRSPAATCLDAEFNSDAVTMSMRFHVANTYARLQEWPTKLSGLNHTHPGETPCSPEVSQQASATPVTTLQEAPLFEQNTEAGALERILLRASQSTSACDAHSRPAQDKGCLAGVAEQSLSARLALMAMQANEFLKEYTAYAVPVPGLLNFEQATTTGNMDSQAVRTPEAMCKLSGDVSFSSLTPPGQDASSPTPPAQRYAIPDCVFNTYFQALQTPQGHREVHMLHGPAVLDSSRCSLQVLGTPFLQYPENPLFGLEADRTLSNLGSAIASHPVLHGSLDAVTEGSPHHADDQMPSESPSSVDGASSSCTPQAGSPEVQLRQEDAQGIASGVHIASDSHSGELETPSIVGRDHVHPAEVSADAQTGGDVVTTLSQQRGKANGAQVSRIPSCRQSSASTRSSSQAADGNLSNRSAVSPIRPLPTDTSRAASNSLEGTHSQRLRFMCRALRQSVPSIYDTLSPDGGDQCA